MFSLKHSLLGVCRQSKKRKSKKDTGTAWHTVQTDTCAAWHTVRCVAAGDL